jgi:hypothetical protein
MSVRSLRRATAAAGALTLALSGTASAVPARPDAGDPAPTAVAPKVAPAPTWPLHPQALTPPSAPSASANTDFQWGDAGIGAGGALLVVVVAAGGAMAIRRRHVADPPLAA